MRKKSMQWRAEIAAMIRAALSPLIDEIRAALSPLIDEIGELSHGITELGSDIAEIQPVNVELDQALADRIVEKIHGPLTISKEFSEWVASQGRYHDSLYTFNVGYGSDAGRGMLRLKGNGTMQLELQEGNGAILWMGTFVPPDFGKERTEDE